MTIQTPNIGTGDGQTGDNELVIRQKYNANFSNPAHAASRLVGGEFNNVMEVGAFGLGLSINNGNTGVHPNNLKYGTMKSYYNPSDPEYAGIYAMLTASYSQDWVWQQRIAVGTNSIPEYRCFYNGTTWSPWLRHLTSGNTTVDSNGFIKAASPIVKVFAEKIESNTDAEQQDITFVKNSTGDYTLKNTTGFASEGWYIEVPQDANKNPLFAVEYSDNDGEIRVRTYERMFDAKQCKVMPNKRKPIDIPDGRWLDVRLNELPAEETEDEL